MLITKILLLGFVRKKIWNFLIYFSKKRLFLLHLILALKVFKLQFIQLREDWIIYSKIMDKPQNTEAIDEFPNREKKKKKKVVVFFFFLQNSKFYCDGIKDLEFFLGKRILI